MNISPERGTVPLTEILDRIGEELARLIIRAEAAGLGELAARLSEAMRRVQNSRAAIPGEYRDSERGKS